MGMIQKQGNWVSYELKSRNADFAVCQRSVQCCSYEEIKKKLDSWIASKDASFFRDEIRKVPERWEKVVISDGQYFD